MKKKSKFKNLIIAFIGLYVCYILVSQQITIRNKRVQLEQCKKELQEVNENQQKLLDETEMSKTYRYVEKLARERLGFIKQGENVVVQKQDK
ncbi:septum formation initiator family protein [Clostridium aestuarii]|uniref:Septum formation initiator family protein n=1 Tax=Clostridium aestuarii TaxID=338193 RepID=A0ABT4D3A5_9CLOT|nr:septum formation initiator family protein [Clostridium aestuarii]MCY6485716.1 septum formation initiator family protein [Clostridium aestuarii]